jgi:hypothetical protein
MNRHWQRGIVLGGLAVSFFGGLAGCGDGVDQDNGVSDGQQKDAVDNDTQNSIKKAEKKIIETKNDIKSELKKNGIGDGVNQDNGISDGEKNKNP